MSSTAPSNLPDANRLGRQLQRFHAAHPEIETTINLTTLAQLCPLSATLPNEEAYPATWRNPFTYIGAIALFSVLMVDEHDIDVFDMNTDPFVDAFEYLDIEDHHDDKDGGDDDEMPPGWVVLSDQDSETDRTASDSETQPQIPTTKAKDTTPAASQTTANPVPRLALPTGADIIAGYTLQEYKRRRAALREAVSQDIDRPSTLHQASESAPEVVVTPEIVITPALPNSQSSQGTQTENEPGVTSRGFEIIPSDPRIEMSNAVLVWDGEVWPRAQGASPPLNLAPAQPRGEE